MEQLLAVQSREDFYDMANLFPRHTGLPFAVWISVRGNARHDVRIKVSPGSKAQPEEVVSVGIRPTIQAMEGEIEAEDMKLLTNWIEMNRKTIIDYWDGEIDTVDAVIAIRPIGDSTIPR